ncbi:MAG TPA: PaaI family thioesterase [Burkholderiales bacterium]|nr:PaaI family thioesterase [Burkholderiales bacterium]
MLRGIARNREPGLHFAGHFLGISWDRVEPQETRLSLDAGPHLAGADGELHIGALAMLADFALANCMRAILEPHQRLATVSMTLELTDAPRTGRLEAHGRFHGFIREGKGRIGKSEVLVVSKEKPVCVGTGAFMALDPPADVKLHPVPHRKRSDPEVSLPPEKELSDEERRVLEQADAALGDPHPSFIERFWGCVPHRTAHGASCKMPNGPHIGNRVGHAQGGVLLGLAASTAACALPSTWRLSSLSGWYLRPGQGAALSARSTVVHHGRLTGVVRTEVSDPEGATVIEVMTTHAHR